MTDPISLAAGLIAFVTFAIDSSQSLYETIESFKNHQRHVRELNEELKALESVLQALKELLQTSADTELGLLELPLRRCGQACTDFESLLVKCAAHSNKPRTSFRDWLKLRYMGDDIQGFKNMLAGYKSTISIALGGATLRKLNVTAKVLQEYSELIKDTKTDLEDRLCEINEKLQAISSHPSSTTDVTSEEHYFQEERQSTQQCLEICEQVSKHIDERALSAVQSEGASSSGINDERVRGDDAISSHSITIDALSQCKKRLEEATLQLHSRLQSIEDRLNGGTNQYLQISTTEQREMKEELESIKRSIEVCGQASDTADKARMNVFEDVATADDGHQVIVSTIGDLITARHIKVGDRSAQWIGQMSDETLQQMSRNRVPGWTGTMVERPTEAGATDSGVQFQTRYGTGRNLKPNTSNAQ